MNKGSPRKMYLNYILYVVINHVTNTDTEVYYRLQSAVSPLHNYETVHNSWSTESSKQSSMSAVSLALAYNNKICKQTVPAIDTGLYRECNKCTMPTGSQ